MPRQPAAGRAGVLRHAALHRRHRLKMGAGLIPGPAGMDNRHLPRLVQGHQGREGGMQPKETVQIQRPVCRISCRFGRRAAPEPASGGCDSNLRRHAAQRRSGRPRRRAGRWKREHHQASGPCRRASDRHAAEGAAGSAGETQGGQCAEGKQSASCGVHTCFLQEAPILSRLTSSRRPLPSARDRIILRLCRMSRSCA